MKSPTTHLLLSGDGSPSRSAGPGRYFTLSIKEDPMESEIIPVTTTIIEEVEKLTCDARKLHEFLQIGRDFSNWIKGRIDKYGFMEGVDYIVFAKSGENSEGRPRMDYALTLDMAKELAMVENNERGRQVRRYFIACERRAREISRRTPENMYEYAKAFVEEHERRHQIEECFHMVKPTVPIGTISAANGCPRNRLVRAYPRTSKITVSVPDEYRHQPVEKIMQTFLIDSNGPFDRFIPAKTTIRIWFTRDRTGLQLWREFPSFDNDANAFYGGEMLHLQDHGRYNISMNCCVAIDIPIASL